MSGSGRDARRRRILEGSQDRLAFITGRVQNVPSISSQLLSSDPISSDGNGSSQPFIYGNPNPKPGLSAPASVSQKEADKPLDYAFSKQDQADEPNRGNTVGGSREEPFLQRREIGLQNPSKTTHHISEVRVGAEASSSARRPSFSIANPEQLLASVVNLFGSITPQQLRSAVSATEHTRLSCSFAMGIFMLVSYVGFPIIGSKVIKSIIPFRPFVLLLVTNVTLIALRLLSELERYDKNQDGNMLFGQDGYGWAEEAGRALEVGLMLQSVMGSLLMDFSVYAITVICGLCLC